MEIDDGVTAPGASVQPRKPRKALRVALVLVAVTVVGAAALIGVGRLSSASSARGDLDSAIEKLSAAEPGVLQVDNAVRSEITSALVPASTEALDVSAAASSDLNDALAYLDEAVSGLSNGDAVLAAAVRDAVLARKSMLSEADSVLKVDMRAGAVLDAARDAWTLAAEAGTLTVNAATEYNKHTKAGVEASTKASNEATAKLKAARSLLDTVTAGFPEADMSPFTSYIDARLKLLDSSRKIDATWLSGKVEDANKLLDAYNAEEKKVVAQATALTTTPAGALAAAYETLTKDAIARYFEARDAARAADDRVKAAAAQ
ncbi:MAG: hypothetical protein D9V44_08235 [Actinobacteria bacterium]|nr:MAG: hypothetical protein D9V44_08235 [Actinomycetota bacterium]